jgi:hypothetical protein
VEQILDNIHDSLPKSNYSYKKLNVSVGFDLSYKLIRSCKDIKDTSLVNHPLFPFFISLIPVNRLISVVHHCKIIFKPKIC